MRTPYLLFVLLFFGIEAFCQGPSISWGKDLSSSNECQGRGVVSDAAGNIYSIGTYIDSARVDANPVPYYIQPISSRNTYIDKRGPNGNLIWVRRIGGTLHLNRVKGIAITNGQELLITGNFEGVVDFDPNSGVVNRTSAGSIDFFLLKLNSSGNFVWVETFGGSGTDYVKKIKIDDHDNFYLTGTFSNTVNFGVNSTVNLTANPVLGFIAKYNPFATLLWVKPINIAANDLTVDQQGNVFMTGGFSGIVDFDPGLGVHNLNSGLGPSGFYTDVFILKLDSNGLYSWSTQKDAARWGFGRSIKVGPTGIIYLFHSYNGLFGGGAQLVPISESTGIIWDNYLTSSVITGEFGTMMFDGTAGIIIASGFIDYNSPIERIDITKFNTGGNLLWQKNISTEGDATSIDIDPFGNILVAGYYKGVTDFDPGPASYPLSPVNNTQYASFLLKFGSSNAFPLPIKLDFTAYATSTEEIEIRWKTEQERNIQFFTVERSYDGIHWSKIGTRDSKGNQGKYTLLDDSPFDGKNYYRLKLIDFGTNYTYSETKMVFFNSNQYEVKMFPNPTEGKFFITSGKQLNHAQLQILNSLGRIVYKKENLRGTTFEFDIAQFAAGLYTLELREGDKVSRVKVLKK